MNELATTGGMTPLEVAQVFVQSGMFPDSKSVAAAAAKLIVGRGMGLTDYDSMAGLYIIKGKGACLASNTMAAAIKASGKYDYRAETTDERCEITFFQYFPDGENVEIGVTTFTMEDAKRAGLGGNVWSKYPKAMLFARAISAGYREHCPDALGSAPVYVHAHGESEIPDDEPTMNALEIIDDDDIIDGCMVADESQETSIKKERIGKDGDDTFRVTGKIQAVFQPEGQDFYVVKMKGDGKNEYTTFSESLSQVAEDILYSELTASIELKRVESDSGKVYLNLKKISPVLDMELETEKEN